MCQFLSGERVRRYYLFLQVSHRMDLPRNPEYAFLSISKPLADRADRCFHGIRLSVAPVMSEIQKRPIDSYSSSVEPALGYRVCDLLD